MNMPEYEVTQHAQQRFWERFPGENMTLSLMYSRRLSHGQLRKLITRTGIKHFTPDTVALLNEDVGVLFVARVVKYDPLTYLIITSKYTNRQQYKDCKKCRKSVHPST